MKISDLSKQQYNYYLNLFFSYQKIYFNKKLIQLVLEKWMLLDINNGFENLIKNVVQKSYFNIEEYYESFNRIIYYDECELQTKINTVCFLDYFLDNWRCDQKLVDLFDKIDIEYYSWFKLWLILDYIKNHQLQSKLIDYLKSLD